MSYSNYYERITALEAELAAYKADKVNGWTTEIDKLKQQTAILREALENIKKHYEFIGFHGLSGAYKIADSALQRAGGGE